MDVLIALTLGRDTSHQHTMSGTFQQYITVRQRLPTLTEEANELEDHADWTRKMRMRHLPFMHYVWML